MYTREVKGGLFPMMKAQVVFYSANKMNLIEISIINSCIEFTIDIFPYLTDGVSYFYDKVEA